MRLLPGDFAPHFKCASSVNPQFHFDTVAGRYVVMSFFSSTTEPLAAALLSRIAMRAEQFDVEHLVFFGVTTDPDDVQRTASLAPGQILFHDIDHAVSQQFGVIDPDTRKVIGRTFVLDQSLRVIAVLRLVDDVDQHMERIFSVLDSLPALSALTGIAPVLIVPYVFEPEFCRELIRHYETKGGFDSGFMRDVNGETVGTLDYAHKRRMDCEIDDDRLIRAAQERIKRRIVPAIQQAYQFNVTRIERHIVACYDAEQGAHFRAHRDNTTLGTAHRRFAVTINLNSSEYEGGEIWFPEFGPKKFKAPSGSAIVFSCSLLHEVPKVTRGKRYAFLPFLYDEAGAAVRERNRRFVSDPASIQPQSCSATPITATAATTAKLPMLDGTCGCGNPNGCGTCLTAPTYALGQADS